MYEDAGVAVLNDFEIKRGKMSVLSLKVFLVSSISLTD